jgi:hypothetical protein
MHSIQYAKINQPYHNIDGFYKAVMKDKTKDFILICVYSF